MSFNEDTKRKMNIAIGKIPEHKRTCEVCFSGDPTQPKKCSYLACPGKAALALEEYERNHK